MSDDEIKALREESERRQRAFGPDLPVPLTLTTTQVIALTDEALARGAALECMREEAACEYNRLRERVAQLETALRETLAMLLHLSPGHRSHPLTQRANAALAAGKP